MGTMLPSRYDMMVSGKSSDPYDGQAYPDTLLVNYNNFKYFSPPTQIAPNDRMLNAPYVVSSAIYSITAYEDVVLNINAVTQISLLYNYPVIKFPTLADLTTFMRG